MSKQSGKAHDEHWVVEQAKEIASIWRTPNGYPDIDEDFPTELNLGYRLKDYKPLEASAIFWSIAEGICVGDGPGMQSPEPVHPESLVAYMIDGYDFVRSDQVALWCAGWVEKHFGRDAANKMYADFDADGGREDIEWTPD